MCDSVVSPNREKKELLYILKQMLYRALSESTHRYILYIFKYIGQRGNSKCAQK